MGPHDLHVGVVVCHRTATKIAKVQINGIQPSSARPAPIPIILASATPTLNDRSGYFSTNFTVLVDLPRSALMTTTRSFLAGTLSGASPQATRVAFPPMVHSSKIR